MLLSIAAPQPRGKGRDMLGVFPLDILVMPQYSTWGIFVVWVDPRLWYACITWRTSCSRLAVLAGWDCEVEPVPDLNTYITNQLRGIFVW